jgi:molybdopterin-containing oxidoreductase family iron-sulfur binding subunit
VLEAFAREFAATTPSMVIAGGGGSDALEVALAANALNQSRGNVGVTIKPNEGHLGFDRMASPAELRALAERMNSGGVSLLMVRGANPAFTLPKAAGFAAAMAKVPFKVSFSSVPDDTSELADLILPDHHPLEQWGDAEPVRGTISLQQPTMDPVFDTRATSDVLIAIAKKDPGSSARYTMPDYRSWLIGRFPGGAAALTAALPRGIASGSLGEATTARVVPAVRAAAPIEQSSGNMYLVVYSHPMLGDGRGANKPWLQEIPDPVTKICDRDGQRSSPRRPICEGGIQSTGDSSGCRRSRGWNRVRLDESERLESWRLRSHRDNGRIGAPAWARNRTGDRDR